MNRTDQALAKLREWNGAAHSDAIDSEETCTRKPDCPGYAAVGRMHAAEQQLERLAQEGHLLRAMEALRKYIACRDAAERGDVQEETRLFNEADEDARGAFAALEDAILGKEEEHGN